MRDRLVSVSAAILVALTLNAAPAVPATLHVGSDVSGAPFEFYPAKTHAPAGFNVDLLHAMSAKLGDSIEIVNHRFDDLLAAVRRGSFDATMSAISDTRQREKLVDFVDYFVAGGGIMVPKGNPLKIYGIDALCGRAITIESGTSYEADLNAQSSLCKTVGLGPIRILTFPTDDEAFSAFLNGKGDAYVADYPVGEYRAHYANDGRALEVVGKQFDVVPYGIAVSKKNVALRDAIQRALTVTIADGTYDRLLQKWGLLNGALRSAPINAGTLFQQK